MDSESPQAVDSRVLSRPARLARRGVCVAAALVMAAAMSGRAAERATDGLVALYDFSAEDSDGMVRDRSGANPPLDLKIENGSASERKDGGLEMRSGAVVRSERPGERIANAVRESRAVTLEAWVRSARRDQTGPARILTMSADTGRRNFTLGQDGDRFDVRFRTDESDPNGNPSLATKGGVVKAEATHVVFTRSRDGAARIFIDGELNAEARSAGQPQNWDGEFRLGVGNEMTGDRPWEGSVYLVAIYGRDLSGEEVARNFRAGYRGGADRGDVAGEPMPAEAPSAPSPASKEDHFHSRVAPLLVQRCIDCHGPDKQKGKLDLSARELALAGGKDGPAIVPGDPDKSLLWETVASDEMPEDGPPLSAEEKDILRRWIEAGAPWTDGVVESLIAARESSAGSEFLRRLTVSEYIETVRAATGVDVAEDARRILPPDLRADGFSNTAYNLNVDLGHVRAYAELASIIASRIDAKAFAREFVDCSEVNDECVRRLVAGMGKRLFRRPIEDGDAEPLVEIARAVREAGGDFEAAMRFLVEAMVQAPQFLYRIEDQTGDGGRRPADPYELASRISYAVWGAPPDGELIKAADEKSLSRPEVIDRQLDRMLRDRRAAARSIEFASQWLHLDRLDALRPNADRFAAWDPALAGDMRTETIAFFEDVVWKQSRPLYDLLNAQVAHVTPRLARHYQMELSESGNAGPGSASDPDPGARGLMALYRFDEGDGDMVRDVSKSGEPIDLKIADMGAVERLPGELRIEKPTLIMTAEPPRRLIEAVKKSREFTVAVHVTPAEVNQTGPARIVTLSAGSGARNFTVGQEGTQYQVRFRDAKTDANGLPGLNSRSGAAGAKPARVVYTRAANGVTRLFVDGQLHAEGRGSDDDLSSWDDGFHLAFGNETTRDRPWRGTLHSAAIYSRALDPESLEWNDDVLARVDVSGIPSRGGLLTQGSALTVGGDNASMVARGLFVLHDFLDGSVDDPPPCVNTEPIPTKPGLSQREIAMQRLADASCGGCHSKFEPLAFGLERFDGLGSYHARDDHGNELREDGEIRFPGSDETYTYGTSAELMDLLAGSARVREVITRKAVQFALGRPLSDADDAAVRQIHAAAMDGGATYRSLLSAILKSDLIQTVQTEKATP